MPLRRPSAFAALAVAAALACTRDGPTPPEVSVLRDGATSRVEMTRLRAEPYPLAHFSGLRESARLVVRDAAQWQATWAAIWAGRTPQPALPAIDFAREMVVVAALGERPSGGYAILLDSAARQGETMVVYLRTLSPGRGCMLAAAITQPVDAARLPRHDGAIEFRERAEVVGCD